MKNLVSSSHSVFDDLFSSACLLDFGDRPHEYFGYSPERSGNVKTEYFPPARYVQLLCTRPGKAADAHAIGRTGTETRPTRAWPWLHPLGEAVAMQNRNEVGNFCRVQGQRAGGPARCIRRWSRNRCRTGRIGRPCPSSDSARIGRRSRTERHSASVLAILGARRRPETCRIGTARSRYR